MERTQFRFEVGGETYKYLGYLGAADALLIKQHAGLSVLGLFNGIMESDPAALVGLVFLTKRQSGERITWDEVVAQLDGEDDLLGLVDTLVPIGDDKPAPAEKVGRKVRAKKDEPAPDVEPAESAA